ncbi:Hem25p KNAG_0A05480 [Huiozyma naganishii CBS 8797]|uniref:Mitochondrial glycine transporter n=1 Tax=Huiozyma naganishii (strain ATCC MYA-139 / BCRC 22969 / CBS 8797 / KCTC 17520 / NBRC 10181 / NCYC 3082 / Yp74L-3) TaxID=1071383 RepID=J7RF72_HUIN7|nr:hypothetical protein KNAG_0A05480 [Kazachstania naganishii CBS 8797]CCK68213.1 hypothetical protein KNAG_0A05480 [Kazachstania naganishii CBS 8797]
MPSQSNSTSKSKSHLIGGFVGGLTSAVALQPLDLLKTRIQQIEHSTLFLSLKGIKNPLELWRGTLPSALRTSVGSALYLSCLNKMRTYINSHSNGAISQYNKSSTLPQLTMSQNLATGALARGLVGYILMPVTILKVRYESTMYNYTSLWQATKAIYATDGINGFFKGFGATCLRDAPYAGLYVLLYEQSKKLLPTIAPKFMISYNEDGNYARFTATGINAASAINAASIATTITAPFDTIKTRMQLQPTRFRNSWQTFSYIFKHERFNRLFSGLSMRLARKAISAGIAWGIYEELIKHFDHK